MNQKPIKFLDAYTKEDKNIFFGRDKESKEIHDKVKQSNLTLLYGLSGTGKTSLVQCGLANMYANEDWLPLFVRRGNNIIKSLRNSINQKADTLIHPKANITDAINSLYLDYFTQVTLIFDQFEELFISGKTDEQEEFINLLADLLNSNVNVKIILILREEYLAYLDKFEKEIPIIFNNRLRLERMRKAILTDVIKKIAEKGKIKLQSKEIPKRIIENISDKKGIDLPYLQVYLDKLYSQAKKENDFSIFDLQLINKVGKLDDILIDFLDEQITGIEKEFDKDGTTWNILKSLITDDGTKRQIDIHKLIRLLE